MKIKICWYDETTDKEMKTVGSVNYDEDVFYASEFEDFVDELESTYNVTLDSIGDGDFMEYSMANDVFTNNINSVAEWILEDMEEFLSVNYSDSIKTS